MKSSTGAALEGCVRRYTTEKSKCSAIYHGVFGDIPRKNGFPIEASKSFIEAFRGLREKDAPLGGGGTFSCGRTRSVSLRSTVPFSPSRRTFSKSQGQSQNPSPLPLPAGARENVYKVSK